MPRQKRWWTFDFDPYTQQLEIRSYKVKPLLDEGDECYDSKQACLIAALVFIKQVRHAMKINQKRVKQELRAHG